MTPTPAQIASAFTAALAKYPLSQKYGVLLRTHSEFDAARMAEHEALFEGGKLFDAQLAQDKFLIKRESEKQGGGSGNVVQKGDVRYENPSAAVAADTDPNVGGNTFALRKKYVSYKQRVAGLIHFIIAGVCSSPPVIVATKDVDAAPATPIDKFLGFFGINRRKKDASDPKIQFYHNLNKNADGRGSSLLACKSALMRDIAVHGRAFAGVAFPQPELDPQNANELGARQAGAFNATNAYFSALEIDDWECDANGLCMIRRHFFTMERSNPTLQPDLKFENWAFITAAGIFTYRIQWKQADNGDFEAPESDDNVTLLDKKPNGLGEMPVHMVDVGIHIMERLRPCVLDQINLNCDLRWAMQRVVYALQIFFTKQDLKRVDPDTMAMKLDTADRSEVVSPNVTVLEPLFKALDRNDDEAYESMMALILKSAAQASNGRQSGEAKRMDYNTFETFLLIFSEPLRAILQWQLETIQRMRGDDDVIVSVQGLDDFDIESVAQILANAKAFFDMVANAEDLPPTARQGVLLRAYRAVMGPAATPEQLEQVVKEIAAKGAEPPKPPEPIAPALIAPPKPPMGAGA